MKSKKQIRELIEKLKDPKFKINWNGVAHSDDEVGLRLKTFGALLLGAVLDENREEALKDFERVKREVEDLKEVK